MTTEKPTDEKEIKKTTIQAKTMVKSPQPFQKNNFQKPFGGKAMNNRPQIRKSLSGKS